MPSRCRVAPARLGSLLIAITLLALGCRPRPEVRDGRRARAGGPTRCAYDLERLRAAHQRTTQRLAQVRRGLADLRDTLASQAAAFRRRVFTLRGELRRLGWFRGQACRHAAARAAQAAFAARLKELRYEKLQKQLASAPAWRQKRLAPELAKLAAARQAVVRRRRIARELDRRCRLFAAAAALRPPAAPPPQPGTQPRPDGPR